MAALVKAHSYLARAFSACLVIMSTVAIAQAGAFADFERSLAAAYAPYRAALMQSNQKDRASTEASLNAFAANWLRLMSTYRSAPPPQYADDPGWPATIAAVESIITAAKADVTKGDLAKAHDVLEGVRDRLGELRARNGVITLSDRLDAYHEKMEQVLSAKPGEGDRVGMLREDAAVLNHLTALVEKHAPAAVKADPAFKEGLAGLLASVKALQDAARGGDAAAIGNALKGLKPAYARIFLKFG